MKWLEYSLVVEDDAVEAAAELLQEFCKGGTIIDDPKIVNRYRAEGRWDYSDLADAPADAPVVIKGYFPADSDCENVQLGIAGAVSSRLQKYFRNVRVLPVNELDEIDWSTAWKKYFHVLKVGNGMVIKPTWEKYQPLPGEHVIEIDPGMAFGTGTHATTKMCIELMERYGVAGKQIYDVGTGSGILAIAAALLGAKSVRAVDIDAVAVRTAVENVELNKLSDKVIVAQGDLLSGLPGRCDFLVANIIADVINLLLPTVPEKLLPGGKALFSGIILEREADVLNKIDECGLRCIDRLTEDGWCALLVGK